MVRGNSTALWRFFDRVISLGVDDDCDDDERTTRRVLAAASVGVMFPVPVWGVLYIGNGEVLAGLIPIVYTFITILSFVALWRFGGWRWFRVSQIVQHLFLPFLLMWALGGFAASSAIIIWALLAPLSAMWSGRSREAIFWTLGFVALTVVSGVIDPLLSGTNGLPSWLRTTFFVGNFVVMTGVIFLLLNFFVGQKNTMVEIMRRNRELESAYLEQEVTLRQSDKLATLGKLSAGLAHELNNPTAAAQQAASQLSSLLTGDDPVAAEARRLGLEPDGEELRSLVDRLDQNGTRSDSVDPLERSDREQAIQDHLESIGVESPWELSPMLVDIGLQADDVQRVTEGLAPDDAAGFVKLVASQFERRSLLGSLDESTARIIDLVGALKSYTRLDEAPRQRYDVHEGLDSTLLMLRSSLSPGVEVRRSYASDLPEIEAFGSELNQVWTNIIDNAIDAMNGTGVITIATRVEDERVVIDLSDDGPGVPPDLIETIFDPFVTTKPPGAGTGLGLNISHNIVVQKHSGTLTVSSAPGRTTFVVTLPIDSPVEDV
ncbi:MAG: sensor histidine kinase [Acidimicrobiales bacterium]